MGEHLLHTFPSTLQTIWSLDKYLSSLRVPPLWKIESLLSNPGHGSLVNEPEFSQPICTAVQIALVDLMSRWGVRLLATIGHSSGMYSTLCSRLLLNTAKSCYRRDWCRLCQRPNLRRGCNYSRLLPRKGSRINQNRWCHARCWPGGRRSLGVYP